MMNQTNHDEEHDILHYGDDKIASAHAPMPKWLRWFHVVITIWGFLWLYLFWNGSFGWFDRGYWHEMQKAANTTMPFKNLDD